jgi:uncharacterized membrane protein YcaP (DUF421 family)
MIPFSSSILTHFMCINLFYIVKNEYEVFYMLTLPIRAGILYILVVIIVRIMGKHQIGQLQPYELVITILISELAAVPMQDTDIPLINGIIPILTLLLIQITLSLISLKSATARLIICGGPSILIENGKIQQSELTKLRYSINDLLEQLRLKNIPNISDVEYAILETSGKLSVIPKSQKRPVNPEDLKITTSYEGLPMPLIIDGVLQRKQLKKSHITEDWLQSEISKFGLSNWNQILLASLDTTGRLFIQPKDVQREIS